MGLNIAQIELLQTWGWSDAEIAEMDALSDDRDCRSAGAERAARYRARMDISQSEWAQRRLSVLERDAHSCTYCGDHEDLTCDHVLPMSRGGTSDLENLTTACRPCNGGKSGRTVEEWRS